MFFALILHVSKLNILDLDCDNSACFQHIFDKHSNFGYSRMVGRGGGLDVVVGGYTGFWVGVGRGGEVEGR